MIVTRMRTRPRHIFISPLDTATTAAELSCIDIAEVSLVTPGGPDTALQCPKVKKVTGYTTWQEEFDRQA